MTRDHNHHDDSCPRCSRRGLALAGLGAAAVAALAAPCAGYVRHPGCPAARRAVVVLRTYTT